VFGVLELDRIVIEGSQVEEDAVENEYKEVSNA
jgi:hypothetical protein